MEGENLNLLEVGSKAQNKSELHRIFVAEEGYYLAPEKETSMLFISKIAIGDKKVLNLWFLS